MEQVFGEEILFIHVDTRSPILSQCEGSHCFQTVELSQFLPEKGFSCLLA
jgi:hypothetical protein